MEAQGKLSPLEPCVGDLESSVVVKEEPSEFNQSPMEPCVGDLESSVVVKEEPSEFNQSPMEPCVGDLESSVVVKEEPSEFNPSPMEPCVGDLGSSVVVKEEPSEFNPTSVRATGQESCEAQQDESQNSGSNSSSCSKYFSSSVESKVVVIKEPPELYPTSVRATGQESSEADSAEPHNSGSNSSSCSKYFSSSVESKVVVIKEPPELYPTSVRATGQESSEADSAEPHNSGSNFSRSSKCISGPLQSKTCSSHRNGILEEDSERSSHSVVLGELGSNVVVKDEPLEFNQTSLIATGHESSEAHQEQSQNLGSNPSRYSKYFSSSLKSQMFPPQCSLHSNGMLEEDGYCSSQSVMLGEDSNKFGAPSSKFGAECIINTNHDERKGDGTSGDETTRPQGVFARMCALQSTAPLSVYSDEMTNHSPNSLEHVDHDERIKYVTNQDSTTEPRNIFLTQVAPQSTPTTSVFTDEMKTSHSPKSLEKTLEMVKKRKNGISKIEGKSRRKRKPSKPSKCMDYCNETFVGAVGNGPPTEATTPCETNQVICKRVERMLKPSKPKKSMDYCNGTVGGVAGYCQPSTEATAPCETDPVMSTESAPCETDQVMSTENGPSALTNEPFFSPQHMHFLLNRYECLKCGRTYRSSSALNVHIRTHAEAKPFRCTECDKGFTQKHSLTVHMRIHTGERPYVCTECGAAFADKKTLQNHKSQNHLVDSNLETFKCTICPKLFPQKANLTCHMMNTHAQIHSAEKPFRCLLCDKGFTQNHSYKAHMRIHTGERPYLCTECGTAFADNKTLQNHKALHSDQKTFKCTICPKMFRQRAGLACHMKTHTDEKPFGCEQCGQWFKTKSTLKNHQRIHSEEKPYQCPMCPQAFKQRAGLACHSKVHEKGNPYVPVTPMTPTVEFTLP